MNLFDDIAFARIDLDGLADEEDVEVRKGELTYSSHRDDWRYIDGGILTYIGGSFVDAALMARVR